MKKNIHTKPKKVKISQLESHPRQNDFFTDTSASELDELARDMEYRGQQEPIHCCANWTIVRGHRRVEAAKILGWKTIQAVVHTEYNDPEADDVIEELITDNLMRRQLDDLALARCYNQLKHSYSQSDDDSGDARDLLAQRLNCGKSGRTLDRLQRLLALPRDIQDMISRGELKKSHGEKILKLPKKEKDKLFKSLRKGESALTVLRRHKIVKQASPKTQRDIGQELLNFLNTNTKKLNQHVEDLDRLQVPGAKALAVLDDSINFLIAWRDRKQQLFEQSVDSIIPSCTGIQDAGQIDQVVR